MKAHPDGEKRKPKLRDIVLYRIDELTDTVGIVVKVYDNYYGADDHAVNLQVFAPDTSYTFQNVQLVTLAKMGTGVREWRFR